MAGTAELTVKLATLEERVGNHIKFFWTVTGVAALWLAGISAALYTINAKLSGIQATLAPQKIQQAATAPALPNSKKTVVQALEKAKKTGTPIPVQVIAEAGTNFARASKADPTAWPVAIDLINYRSYLNTFSIAVPAGIPAVDRFTTTYHFSKAPPPGRQHPRFQIPEVAVAKEFGAIFEPLGPTAPNAENITGHPAIMATGGYMSLDGMHLRHVLLNGVEVHYSGTALLMEDVVFLNCTFVMDNTEPSRDLAQAIATEANVKFSYAVYG